MKRRETTEILDTRPKTVKQRFFIRLYFIVSLMKIIFLFMKIGIVKFSQKY